MTAIVGVLCHDGLVIGTDSSATFVAGTGYRTIEQPTEKLEICSEAIIIAGAGSVGLGQRFGQIVEKAYSEKLFVKARNHIEVGTQLCRLGREDFNLTGVAAGQYGALVGFPFGNKAYLCEFSVQDFQPEFKTETLWYCSMGSGQQITDLFLALMREIFWRGMPRIQDATFAVTWTLEHAVQVNPGGINGPIRVAVLERQAGKFHARILEDTDLDEHRQNISQAKERLRTFPASQRGDAPDTPEIPKP